MKKFLIAIVMLVGWIGAEAQSFYLGAEGSRMFERGRFGYMNWGAGVFASYSQHLFLRLGIEAQAGLYTDYYNDGLLPAGEFIADPDEPSKREQQYGVTFGGKLGASLTLKIAGPLSLFTGPTVSYNFFQKAYFKTNGHKSAYDPYLYHAMMQWRLGAQAEVWRLRLRLSWDFDVTNRYFCAPRYHTASLSVAYRL